MKDQVGDKQGTSLDYLSRMTREWLENDSTLTRLDSVSLSVGLCSPHAFPVQRQMSIVFSISR